MKKRGIQPALITMLPPGVWHFESMLSRDEQEAMREQIRAVVRAAPLITPTMPGGTAFRLQITNAGAFGWLADAEGGFRYSRKQPRRETEEGKEDRFEGRAWPAIPPLIEEVTQRAARRAGFEGYQPNNCLMNYYEAGTGSLGLHRDDTRGEDFNQPVVTISLGDSAIFGVGGASRDDAVTDIELRSGDVMVMGGIARLYYHRVREVIAGTSDLLPRGGRLCPTLRRVRF